MSTPTGDNDPGQGFGTPGSPPEGAPPPPPPPSGPPPGGDYPPPGGFGQPDYSQVQPDYGQPFGGPPPAEYAGFWIRFAGAFIDSILLSIVASVLSGGVGAGGTTGRSGLTLVLGAIYFTFMHGSRGQSLGQMAVSIKLVDQEGGGGIDYGRAFLRWLVSLVSGFVIAIGYLWMLWDSNKQTWHDKAARVLVVKAR